jgi:PAS domain-containing protein
MDTRSLILVTQGLPEPHLLVSGDGTIREANRAAHAILGYGSRLVGRNLSDISPEAPEKLRAFLRRCSGSRSVAMTVLRLLKNRGHRIVGFRCEGGIVVPKNGREDPLLVIRCREQTGAVSRFATLNSELALLHTTLRASEIRQKKSSHAAAKRTEPARPRSR